MRLFFSKIYQKHNNTCIHHAHESNHVCRTNGFSQQVINDSRLGEIIMEELGVNI